MQLLLHGAWAASDQISSVEYGVFSRKRPPGTRFFTMS